MGNAQGSVVVTGSFHVGGVLTCSHNITDRNGMPATVNYRWYLYHTPIVYPFPILHESTSPTYTCSDACVPNKRVRCQVWFNDLGGNRENKFSPLYNFIEAPKNTPPDGTLDISGIPRDREEINAVINFTDINGINYNTVKYQWKRDGENISEAVDASYILHSDDVGKNISVSIDYTDGEGNDETVTSSSAEISALTINNILSDNNINETVVTKIIDNFSNLEVNKNISNIINSKFGGNIFTSLKDVSEPDPDIYRKREIQDAFFKSIFQNNSELNKFKINTTEVFTSVVQNNRRSKLAVFKPKIKGDKEDLIVKKTDLDKDEGVFINLSDNKDSFKLDVSGGIINIELQKTTKKKYKLSVIEGTIVLLDPSCIGMKTIDSEWEDGEAVTLNNFRIGFGSISGYYIDLAYDIQTDITSYITSREIDGNPIKDISCSIPSSGIGMVAGYNLTMNEWQDTYNVRGNLFTELADQVKNENRSDKVKEYHREQFGEHDVEENIANPWQLKLKGKSTNVKSFFSTLEPTFDIEGENTVIALKYTKQSNTLSLNGELGDSQMNK